jgi:DNA-binding CsgD family transcriptional regulator
MIFFVKKISKIFAERFGFLIFSLLLCTIIKYKNIGIMQLTKKKAEIIKNWLAKSDIREIAGILGYSENYVRKILNGKRNYTNLAGEEVIRLALRKARSNKYFRTTCKKTA